MHIGSVILAGGKASRMGGADKAFLPLAGKPLLAHVLARLAPQVSDIIISANGDLALTRRNFRRVLLAESRSHGATRPWRSERWSVIELGLHIDISFGAKNLERGPSAVTADHDIHAAASG